MIEPSEIPNDVDACQSLLRAQAVTIASQAQKLEELSVEMEKLRKLLSHLVNGWGGESRLILGKDWSGVSRCSKITWSL